MCNVKLRSVRVTTVIVEKTISITRSECESVALIIQHKKLCAYYVAICGLSSSIQYFSTLSHKRQVFRENVIEYKICFDFLYKFRLKRFSLQEEFIKI